MNRSRLDTLRVKLFLAIAGGTAALALAAYLVFSWSFERGFMHYVNEAEEARMQPLIERLAAGYGREGGWKWAAEDRRRWYRLLRETFGAPPLTIDPRLMLFDGERNRLIGRQEAARQALLKPIAWQGRTVGYLGYVPRPDVVESIEQLYLRRQHLTFGAIGIGLIGAGLLLAAGLAHWLARRIGRLARATDSLIHGDYDVRLEPSGHDELARLARDLNTLAETLAAARLARRQWIADIAHELRTPLSVLRAEIEALQDGVRPLDRNAVNSLAGEAARLARLVEDLHTLALSDLGALSYHKEPVELAEIAAEVIAGHRKMFLDKNIALHSDLQSLRILGDADRLAQVFTNLLQNSLRYTDAPGRVAVTVGDGRVVWEDSSPGVPAQDLPRITERLYRVEGSRSRNGGGSGLGLAIASAIVEAHGGTLEAAASRLGGLRIELRFAHA